MIFLFHVESLQYPCFPGMALLELPRIASTNYLTDFAHRRSQDLAGSSRPSHQALGMLWGLTRKDHLRKAKTELEPRSFFCFFLFIQGVFYETLGFTIYSVEE
jgi:hypothetical protein